MVHSQFEIWRNWDLRRKTWVKHKLSLDKSQDLLLIRKFVRRMKGSKHEIFSGQIFKKAANFGSYSSQFSDQIR